MSLSGHQSAAMKNDEWLTPPEILRAIAEQAGIRMDLWNQGAASMAYSEGCEGVTREHLERFAALYGFACWNAALAANPPNMRSFVSGALDSIFPAPEGALPDAMTYAAARSWAVTNEWCRGWDDARAALAAPAPQAAHAVTVLDAFDAAVATELPRVSHVEYDSHEICKHFAGEVRKRLAAAPQTKEPTNDR